MNQPKRYTPIIVRKEVDNEHYYQVDGKFFPSVTKILQETMPMPFALRYWIGEVGNEKAEKRLQQAGDRGTAIHEACGMLMRGETVNLLEKFPQEKDKKCLTSFIGWFNEYKPTYKDEHIEFTVASQKGYAGTLDLFCEINNEPWIIDFKTSASVYDSHKLQITAYRQAFFEMTGIEAKTGILHLNPKTKKGWTFHQDLELNKKSVTIDDFMIFFEAYKVLNGGKIPEPSLVDKFPDIITLFEKETMKGGEQSHA